MMTKPRCDLYKVAELLDLTLDVDARGPKTFNTRRRVAEALDRGRCPSTKDVAWLKHVVRSKGR